MRRNQTFKAVKEFLYSNNIPQCTAMGDYLMFYVKDIDDKVDQWVKEINKIVNKTQNVNVEIHKIDSLIPSKVEYGCKFDTKPGYMCVINIVYHRDYLFFDMKERKKKSYD